MDTWTVVLPVKGGVAAKSRLAPAGAARRADLARAVALDTVRAVLAARRPAGPVGEVRVVTGDPAVADEHAGLGCVVVADPGDGLDAALRAGTVGAADGPCALLLADLPALRAAELADALAACTRLLAAGAAQVVVPDADGVGTVMLAAARAEDLRPAFGGASLARHVDAGAVVLEDAPWGLRRDVDTAGQLEEVLHHGAGAETTAAAGPGTTQPRSTMAPSEASFSPKCS